MPRGVPHGRSQSYPFLSLARNMGMDYGDVLHFATLAEQGCEDTATPQKPDTYWERRARRLKPEQRREVRLAVAREERRRQEV